MATTVELAYRLSAATGMHRGDRAYQQDQVEIIPHPRTPGCALAVLADGMGGKSGGRKAADQVVMVAKQIYERHVATRDDGADLLRQLVQESHLMIKLTAMAAEEEPHSTIAAILVGPDRQCDIVHAGDSRIYHFRGPDMVSRTIDHSFVQRLIDEGQITEEEANTHPAVEPAHRLPGHASGSAADAAPYRRSSKSATACWPAATACGTTSRRRKSAPSCTRCRRAKPARCWSPRHASVRVAAATTCRWH